MSSALHLLPPAPTPRTAVTRRPQGNVTPLFVRPDQHDWDGKALGA